MPYEFKFPDVGEGLYEGEIVQWHVREGDQVQENQPLVNVLTDKAEVEIPSPKSGKILKLFAQPGQKVKVGEILVAIGAGDETYSSAPMPAAQKPPSNGSAAVMPIAPGPAKKEGEILATPAVRKLARELGVDLAKIQGTGPQSRITEEDVRKAAAPAPSTLGPEERIAFHGIRRRTAEKMILSRNTAVHVTHMDEADVTELVALRETLKEEASSKSIKLTYLPFILRAVVKALREFPHLNSSLDEAMGEIVLKKYYNIGIATATEHGLFTVVVKQCDQKSLFELAAEIEKLSNKAKEKKLELADLQGGTFTITNIGPIGGLFATPILNPPEAAILGIMKIVKRPAVHEGQIAIRDKMNLVLSFDHRILDGAEAARFTNHLILSLQNPRTLI